MKNIKYFVKELGLTKLDCILIFCLLLASLWAFSEIYTTFDYDTFVYAFEVV